MSDESIIDVTGQSSYIVYDRNVSFLRKYTSSIPAWSKGSINSFSELEGAGAEQIGFYKIFRSGFLHKQFYDLGANINYAFALLYDLLDEYKSHQQIAVLEKQVSDLVYYYPKVRARGLSSLCLLMEDIKNIEGIERIRQLQQNRASFEQKIGSRFKRQLNLTEYEIGLLDTIWYPENDFCDIEFCFAQVVKLFLLVDKALGYKYGKENTASALVFYILADMVAAKQPGLNAYHYRQTIRSVIAEIHTAIFKHVENAVRELFGHTRRQSVDFSHTDAEVVNMFNEQVISKVKDVLPIWMNRVELPDEQTEIELFTRNTTRWKQKFSNICEVYNSDVNVFFNKIKLLATLNKRNPALEQIYFEASKFIADKNKLTALTLYLLYIYHDSISGSFENRQLSKPIQKILFANTEQLHAFERIVHALLEDKNLSYALESVQKIYLPKRKKIILDPQSISHIKEQHADTVSLLSKYLEDEDEPDNTVLIQPVGDLVIHIPQAVIVSGNLYEMSLDFSPVQVEALNMFRKNNLVLSIADFAAFAKTKSVFKNQLIDQINETCFELLDDTLIEEEEDNYIINEFYFNSILVK